MNIVDQIDGELQELRLKEDSLKKELAAVSMKIAKLTKAKNILEGK